MLYSKSLKLLNELKFYYNRIRYKKKPALYIFCYHEVSDNFPDFISDMSICTKIDIFKKQIEYISNNFKIITINDLNCYSNRPFDSDLAIITFDDGFKGVYDNAFPILKKKGIPATIFYSSIFLEDKPFLWPIALRYIIKTGNEEKLMKLFSDKGIYINSVPEVFRKWVFANYSMDIYKAIHDCINEDYPKVFDNMFINIDNIKDLLDNNFSFGLHTHTHPRMSFLSIEEQEYEIIYCLNKFNSLLKYSPVGWAHPFGKKVDYNQNTINLVKKYLGNKPIFSCYGAANKKINFEDVKRIALKNENQQLLKLKILKNYYS